MLSWDNQFLSLSFSHYPNFIIVFVGACTCVCVFLMFLEVLIYYMEAKFCMCWNIHE